MPVKAHALSLLLAASTFLAASPLAAEEITDSYRATATELMTYLRTEEHLGRLRATMVQREIATDKRWKEFTAELGAHLNQHMDWDTVRVFIVEGYAEHFTEEDLHAILAFYRTSAGVKVLQHSERINQAAFFKGVKLARENMDDLRYKIVELTQKEAADAAEEAKTDPKKP